MTSATRRIGSSRLVDPLPAWAWFGGVLGVTAAVSEILHHWGLSLQDRPQQQFLIQALAGGHVARVLGTGTQTSGPGIGVVTPVYLVARHLTDDGRGYLIAMVSVFVPFGVAWLAASRAAGIPRRSVAELVGLLVGVGGVPVVACVSESFHPSDALAVAACLGAYAAVVHRRLGLAAVLLGFGVATRQWVLVAVAILVILETGRDRAILAGGSLATFAAILAPFLLTGPSATIDALTAPDTVRGGSTLPGLVPLPGRLTYLVSRDVPLVIVLGLCWWLHRRHASFTPAIGVAALTLALEVRIIVDPASFVYYAAPGYAFFVLMVASSWRWSVGAEVGGVLLHVRYWERHRRFSYVPADLHPVEVALSTFATVVFVVPAVVAALRLRRLLPAAGADVPADGVRAPH